MEQVSSPQVLPAGYKLQRYTIQKTLERGATGNVYLAEVDSKSGLFMVQEHMPYGILAGEGKGGELQIADASADGKENARKLERIFREEAYSLQALNHPDLPRVQEVFRALGTAYYVTPCVEGPTLEVWASALPEPSRKTLTSLLEVLLGTLDYIHDNGLLHGDLTPGHIVLRVQDGHPVPTRFGMARMAIGRAVNAPFGTSGYTPSELQSSRGKAGPWSDIYALGAIMYRLITGAPPEDCRNRAIAKADPYAPLAEDAALVAKYGETLLASIDKALQVDPARRWQSAAEWRKVLADIPVDPEPEPAPAHSRKPWVFAVVAFAMLLMGGAIAGSLYVSDLQKEFSQTISHLQKQESQPQPTAEPEQTAPPAPTLSPAELAELNKQLLKAAGDGDTSKVQSLLDRGADVHAKNWSDWTPLHEAASEGRTETAQLLLERGADVDAKDNRNGWTPLHRAAVGGRTETAKLLLERGADVNAKDEADKTPLHWAAVWGRTKTAKLLLERGADVDAKDNSGGTPLRGAAYCGCTETAKLLLEYGADVKAKCNSGWAPRQFAEARGKTETAALLREWERTH